MYRDDYILRLIAQFGAIIRHILGLYRAGHSPLVRIAIDNAYRDRLGVGSDQVVRMSERQLLALLRFHNLTEAWWHEGSYLAALLAVEAHVLADDDESEAAAERALLALHLVIECALAAPVPLPDYTPHYADLLMLLQDYDLPTPTLAALFSFVSKQVIWRGVRTSSTNYWCAILTVGGQRLVHFTCGYKPVVMRCWQQPVYPVKRL
jgi:hypothetical protein